MTERIMPRAMSRTFGLALSSLSLAIGSLGFLASTAQGTEDRFEGSILAACPNLFPFFSCFGYSVDSGVQAGTSFSGSYTLPTAGAAPICIGSSNTSCYHVAPPTGSIQIGASLSVSPSVDPYLGVQV